MFLERLQMRDVVLITLPFIRKLLFDVSLEERIDI
jgi:hypothetical protein